MGHLLPSLWKQKTKRSDSQLLRSSYEKKIFIRIFAESIAITEDTISLDERERQGWGRGEELERRAILSYTGMCLSQEHPTSILVKTSKG